MKKGKKAEKKAAAKQHYIVSVFDKRLPAGFAKRNIQASLTVAGLSQVMKYSLLVRHALSETYEERPDDQKEFCTGVHIFEADYRHHVIDGNAPLLRVSFSTIDEAMLADLHSQLAELLKSKAWHVEEIQDVEQ